MEIPVPNPMQRTPNFERRRSFAIGARKEGFRAGSAEAYFNQNTISIAPGGNIQRAIDQIAATGGGEVVLLNGVHEPENDIVLYSNVTLIGENPVATMVDFGGQAYSVVVHGSDVYEVGTVSVTVGTTTVTGVGTAWTNDMVGRSISLDNIWFTITSVISSTSLTIESEFISSSGGGSLSGSAYSIASILSGVKINNFTIMNSTAPGLDIQYCDYIQSDILYLSECQYGMYVYRCTGLTKTNGGCFDCDYGYYFYYCDGFSVLSDVVYNAGIGDGMRFDHAGDSTIFNFSTSGCIGNGMSFVSAYNMGVLSFTSNDNRGHGIEFISGSNYIELFGAVVTRNGGDGIKMTATSDENQVCGIASRSNTGYGLNIAAASCDNNVVGMCSFVSNTAGQLTNSGTGTKARGNIGNADIG